jgi:hypothetical protein
MRGTVANHSTAFGGYTKVGSIIVFELFKPETFAVSVCLLDSARDNTAHNYIEKVYIKLFVLLSVYLKLIVVRSALHYCQSISQLFHS